MRDPSFRKRNSQKSEEERTFVGIEKEEGERESDASSPRKLVKLRERARRNIQTKGIGRGRNSQKRPHASVDCVIRRGRERAKRKNTRQSGCK